MSELIAQAKALIAEGRHQEAVRTCRRVLLSRPEEGRARLLLGVALLSLRRYDEARVEMLAVLRREPESAPAYRLLGEAYYRTEQHAKARDAIQRAADLDPDDSATIALLTELRAQELGDGPNTVERWFDSDLIGTREGSLPEDAPEIEAERTVIQDMGDELDSEALRQAPSPAGASLASDGPIMTFPAGFQEPFQSSDGSAGELPYAPTQARTFDHERDDEEPPTTMRELEEPPTTMRELEEPPTTMRELPEAAGGDDSSPLDEEPTRLRPPVSEREPSVPGPPMPVVDGSERSQPGPLRPEATVLRPPGGTHGGAAPMPVPGAGPEPSMRRLPAAPPAAAPAVPGRLAAPPAPMYGTPPPSPPHYGQSNVVVDDSLRVPPAGFPGHGPVPESSRPGYGEPGPGYAEPQPLGGVTTKVGFMAGVRQRIRRLRSLPPRTLALAVVGPLALVAVVVVVSLWRVKAAKEELELTVLAACDDGLEESLARAIALDAEQAGDEPADRALRARLYSMAALEHGSEPHREGAVTLIEGLQGTGLPNVHLAAAQLALAEGQIEPARQALGEVQGTGEVSIELARARALVAFHSGDLQGAAVHATSVVSVRPHAPRHVSLYAVIKAAQSEFDEALRALSAIPDAELSPIVRLTRARVLLLTGREYARAEDEARVVIEPPPGQHQAPAYAVAWAHLIRAECAAQRGDMATARTEAERSAQDGPLHNPRYSVPLAQVLLDVGSREVASAVVARLPEGAVPDTQRALLEGEAALMAGDLERATAVVERLPEGPAANFIRGRIAERGGNADAARKLYQEVIGDPRYSARARIRLGVMALARGDVARAVQLLKLAQQQEPANTELVPVLVDALIRQGDADEAQEVASRALQHRPESPALVRAKARSDMAQGRVAQALSRVRKLIETNPDNVELHAELAQMAVRAGRHDEARDALRRTEELAPGHPAARLGRAELAIDEQDAEAARIALQAVEEAAPPGDPTVARLKARLLVLEARGEEAVDAFEDVPEATRTAREWEALGWAYLQAYDDRSAARTFERALREDSDAPEPHLGLSIIALRAGSLSRARSHVRNAEEAMEGKGRASSLLKARILGARARIAFEAGRFEEARDLATTAIGENREASEPHLVLANDAFERGGDAEAHLRRALEGRSPSPEVLGLLVPELGPTDEGCELADRYIKAAPRGWDASAVRRVLNRCR